MARSIATAMALLLVVSGVAPVAAASTQTESSAYAGAHISFETSAHAVTDYQVSNETVFQSVKVQSQSKAENSGAIAIDASLSTMTSLSGSAVTLSSKTKASATVKTESSARLHAHDNEHGILVVDSNGKSQYVQANLSDGASASTTSDGRVIVTTQDGMKGTFLVVGDGKVTVNENGDVAAKLGQDSRLVFRSYPDGRSDEEKQSERLIADGVATAEVYVMERGKETVVDTVSYGEQTTVEVTQTTKSKTVMTAERSKEQGTVIITSVSESVVDSADDVSVTVDGNAAVRASSYSELRSTTQGAQQSKFLVRQQSQAQASLDVLVAVNHFSKRQVVIQDTGEQTTATATPTPSAEETPTDGGQTETTGPGFGALVALLALAAVALLARH